MTVRNSFFGLILFVLLGWTTGSHAAGNIGYVNISKVFEGTAEGKDILTRLQDEHSQKQKELDVRMKDFEEKAKRFQQQSAMLKDDIRKEKLTVLAKEERELQTLYMQYQGDINKKKSEALRKFEQKVMVVVHGVAQKEKLDYILRQEVLLHGPNHMDVTNEVIREYEKRYPVKTKKNTKGK